MTSRRALHFAPDPLSALHLSLIAPQQGSILPTPVAREAAIRQLRKLQHIGMEPLPGRIPALCDGYDALRLRRVYKPAYSHAERMRIPTEGRGTHFDPVLIDLFEIHHAGFAEIFDQTSPAGGGVFTLACLMRQVGGLRRGRTGATKENSPRASSLPEGTLPPSRWFAREKTHPPSRRRHPPCRCR